MSTVSISRSSDYNNLLSKVIELEDNATTDTKKLWIKMAESLDITGVEKSKIWSTVANDIENELKIKHGKDFKWTRSGYFYRVGRDAGYVKSEEVIALGQSENSSTPFNNLDMVELLSQFKDIIPIMINNFKNSKQLEDIFGKKQTREFYRQMNILIKNCHSTCNNKTKIPPSSENTLIEFLSMANSVNTAAKKTLEMRIKHMSETNKFLTRKQATKFLTGGKQSKLPLLKPTERDFAIYLGYYGVQCKCKSWRVRMRTNSHQVECYDCELSFPAKSVVRCEFCDVLLYEDRILHVIKTGKCENCDGVLDLPPSLLNIKNIN